MSGRKLASNTYYIITSSFPICVYPVILNTYRVFAVVLVTARNVTYALNSAPDASQAYKSGRKLLSLILNSGRDVVQEQKKMVRMCMP